VARVATSVSGTGTLFTSEFAVGDLIDINNTGTGHLITNIASDTLMTVVGTGNVAAGAAVARFDDQYSPPVLFQENCTHRHHVRELGGLMYGFWWDSAGTPMLKKPKRHAGLSTITVSASTSTKFIMSAGVETNLASGDVLLVDGLEPLEVRTFDSGTGVGQFISLPSTSIAASTTYRIEKVDDFTLPTGDEDSDSSTITHTEYRDDENTMGGAFTAATTLFNTTPYIKGGAWGLHRALRIDAFGKISGAGDLIIRIKFGGTDFVVTPSPLTHSAGAGSWKLEALIKTNNSMTSTRSIVEFSKWIDGTGVKEGEIVYATDSAGTGETTIDTGLGDVLDITFESNTGTSFDATCYGIELNWE
jgi:hypothetical protein